MVCFVLAFKKCSYKKFIKLCNNNSIISDKILQNLKKKRTIRPNRWINV